jgi:hypothetical protein
VDHQNTRLPEAPHSAAERHVTALYQAHALSLARPAVTNHVGLIGNGTLSTLPNVGPQFGDLVGW